MPADKARLALDASEKATGVTESNFYRLFRAYCYARGGTSDDLGAIQVNPIDSPSEWGAWLGYAKARHLGALHRFMLARGKMLSDMGHGLRNQRVAILVPATWPADFDAEWEAQNDTYNADRFVRKQSERRAVADMDQSQRDKLNVVLGAFVRHRGEAPKWVRDKMEELKHADES